LKSKIEKLAQIETENLDCKSPMDYHEHFSAKSIDESKASVYFTPNDGHLSPQPSQMSPIHVNYLNEEGASGSSRAVVLRPTSSRAYQSSTQRNSFQLPSDFLDEADEGNFIIPDPIYADQPKDDRFDCVHIDDIEGSLSSLSSASEMNRNRRRNKKYREREKRKSNISIENEAFLMHDIMDESTGARRKIPYHLNKMPSTSLQQNTKNEYSEGEIN
jgi:hypothetical protein